MNYEIEYTEQAQHDLEWLKRNDLVRVLSAIGEQLRFEPAIETRNRKRLRPNDTADWELRIGVFRVLYDVDEVVRIVEIQRVGAKPNSRYVFRGGEQDL